MEKQAVPPQHAQRRQARYHFRCDAVTLEVHLEGHPSTMHLVSTRNLSAGGLALVFARSLPPESRLYITLPGMEGQQVRLAGTVAHCTELPGGGFVVGMRFDAEIMATHFGCPPGKA